MKSYVREDHEIEKFEKYPHQFIMILRLQKTDRIQYAADAVLYVCMYDPDFLVWCELIVTTGNDPINGMSTGQLMSLVSYAMQILDEPL